MNQKITERLSQIQNELEEQSQDREELKSSLKFKNEQKVKRSTIRNDQLNFFQNHVKKENSEYWTPEFTKENQRKKSTIEFQEEKKVQFQRIDSNFIPIPNSDLRKSNSLVSLKNHGKYKASDFYIDSTTEIKNQKQKKKSAIPKLLTKKEETLDEVKIELNKIRNLNIVIQKQNLQLNSEKYELLIQNRELSQLVQPTTTPAQMDLSHRSNNSKY